MAAFKDGDGAASVHLSSWPVADMRLIDAVVERQGDFGVDIIAAVRKFKSENKWSMKEELGLLVLISEEKDFETMIRAMEGDLKAVLNVREIQFSGTTTLETERFKVKVGVVK